MNFRNLLVIAIVGFVIAPAAVQAEADIVNRKSGAARAGGVITETTKTEVTVKPTGKQSVAVPANDISSIVWGDAPVVMKLGVGDENNGNFAAALEKFAKAMDDVRSGHDLIKADLEFLIARVTARIALTDPSRRDEAVTKLTGFLKANANNFRFYEAQLWLGQVYLARREFEPAKTAFETLSQSPWSDYQLSAKVNLGRVLMGEDKLDEAAKAFDGAIAAATASPADQARKYEAMVGKARSLVAQNRQAEALTSLNEVVEKSVSTDDSALQAEAYVLQGTCLQATNKTKEAVLAYLHVDVLFARESAFHAEALYHLARLWKTVQHPDRSLEAQAKLEGSYPNSEWTKKLGSGGTE